MRMRKRKWVAPYLESEDRYLVRSPRKGHWLVESGCRALHLEIGMGMGDFLTGSASLFPDILFVGLEKDATCVAKAIRKAEELELKNLLVLNADAKDLCEYFAPQEADRIYLQFSDPWPKKAHAKRRLTAPSFLELYQNILKEEGELILKTDNAGLFEYSLLQLQDWHFEKISVDLHREAQEGPLTEYEKKFMAEGKPIYFALCVNPARNKV